MAWYTCCAQVLGSQSNLAQLPDAEGEAYVWTF
jgi:hypothetical protein